MGRRIVLVGFMGAGKSVVGRSLARRLSASFIDTDDLVLAASDCDSIQELFAAQGETSFRRAEHAAISARAARRPLVGVEVWATGGAALLDQRSERAVVDRRRDVVVWLEAHADVLWMRSSGSDRPLAGNRVEFGELLDVRRDGYARLADIRIDASGPGVDGVADRVLDACRIALSERGEPGGDDLDPAVAIHVARGVTGRMEELIPRLGTQVAIVGDHNVAGIVEAVSVHLDEHGVDVVDQVTLPMGEFHKQLSTSEMLVRRWCDARLTRDATVIAIGGGTLLDVAGFAASIHRRGIRWIAVPTTLLAQVDAGIGGKTGVNVGTVKNAVGTFAMPALTVIDPDVLATLPAWALADGWAEAIKTGLLASADAFEIVHRAITSFGDTDCVSRAIATCAAFKQAICRIDPLDLSAVRAQLNFGHTAAHAIESATAGATSHGRAVGIGMLLALELSVERLGLDRTIADDVRALLSSAGLDLECDLSFDELEPWLEHDKKHTADGLGWVLLRDPGDPVTDVRIPGSEVRAAWEDLFGTHTAVLRQRTRPIRVLVLFGINLADLGDRDPHHYGTQTLADLVLQIEAWGRESGIVVECRQTDSLERFIASIREARHGSCDAMIVNPGAWTHSEPALHDALEPCTIPCVEVHLSDVGAREAWRQESVIKPVVDHTIAGHGADGYRQAIEWIAAQCR